MTAVLAAAGICVARSFDVISTNTGGVEVVMVPIHDGSLMLQFKGQAIYIDSDSMGDTAGMPKADFVFFTAGEKDEPARYAAIRKASTLVVSAPLTEKRAFGEISVESAGKGLVFTMAGRRFSVSGNAAPVNTASVDVAFVCLSAACSKDPAATVKTVAARIVFPYRYGKRDLRGLHSTAQTEVRLRRWD
ncbi:MAG: Metal-dependent hydrolase [Bryobacterales bacterium]|nr:Metal-dependent hydrolase [Bryobacterales bacterium]